MGLKVKAGFDIAIVPSYLSNISNENIEVFL